MANILCIGQDDVVNRLVQSLFGQRHNIVAVVNDPMAIQHCAILQPDVVIMNLESPDVNGYELALRLRMFMPHIPVLFIADGQIDNIETYPFVADANQLLTKPIDVGVLQKKVRAFLPETSQSFSPSDHRIIHHLEAQIAALRQTNRRLASLHVIGALVGTSLDLENLMDEVLGQINKIIAFDSATLFLLKGDVLEAAASRGFLKYPGGMNTYGRNEHNSAWKVVVNKLPLIIHDVTRSDYWEPRPELDSIRSWLGVPLIFNDRVVGVLTLDKNETSAFSEDDAHYLFTLTNQLAVATENAQLFQEWEAQSTRLKLINELSQEISTILNVDELFDTLAKAIFERLQYECVAILEIDEKRSFLTLKAIYGQRAPHFKVNEYRQPIDVGVEGEVIKGARPILVNDISQECDIFSNNELGIRSKLVTPIFVGNQIEAVIDVGRKGVNGFSDQDLWTMSSLASQAAKVIENARLYLEIQTYSTRLERTVVARTQRLHAITKISQVVSQGLAIDELLAVVGQGIYQIFSSETVDDLRVSLGLAEGSYVILNIIRREAAEDHDQTTMAPSKNDSEAIHIHKVLPIKLNSQEPMGQVISQAKPLILRNVDPTYPVGEDQLDGNTLIMVPLITDGKTIGLISVLSEVVDAFDESDLETLELLAFHVAGAIEHARLLRKTKEIAIAEERTRLASDMHDGIAQNLAYLMLQVDRCLNLVVEGSKLETRLEHVSTLLSQNIDELRRNIFDLRPVELEGRSFFDVVEDFVTEFGRRWGLETDCIIKGRPADVPPEVDRSLYRILQETLANARQHAHCTRLFVELATTNDRWITLMVRDNGCGFDAGRAGLENQGKDRGLGLVSMRERAERMGGELTVESLQGQGTCILAKLPQSGYDLSYARKKG